MGDGFLRQWRVEVGGGGDEVPPELDVLECVVFVIVVSIGKMDADGNLVTGRVVAVECMGFRLHGVGEAGWSGF